MFIAHAPAGFLLTRALQRRFHLNRFLWLGLVASVFPDLDLLYFYLFDQQQTLHHLYWTHLPLFWFVVTLVICSVNIFLKNKLLTQIATIFLANIFLHLLLDAWAGGIFWLYPFSAQMFVLTHVPARYPFWLENFVFHWTFLAEITIVTWAFVVLVREQRSSTIR